MTRLEHAARPASSSHAPSRELSAGRSALARLVLATLLAACGSDGDDGADPSTGDAATDGGGGSSTADAGGASGADGGAGNDVDAGADEDIEGDVGNFSIRVVQPIAATGSSPASPGRVNVSGKVYDGVPTAALRWVETKKVGDCSLLEPKAPFCAESCASGFTCVDDDVCARTPTPRDVGEVTLRGVKTGSGTTTAKLSNILGSYGPDTGVSFEYPGFAEGDALELSAAGAGSIGAFNVDAVGVAPLVMTTTRYQLDKAQNLALTWTAAGAGAGTRFRVRLDISHHGGARGLVTCDSADDGALDIDATLIAGLLDLGVAGFPTIVVTRENIGRSDIGAGSVTMTVYSDVERAVEIEGLSSCTADTDCASGQTCQTDLTCK